MLAMIRLLSLLLCAFALAGPATAQRIVVELFANQNCKACPKAHKTLAEVEAEREDVLILTWSVDYWDYLGEADPMAMPEAAERQAVYAERFGLRGPYTPQTVYNGEIQCPGNRPRDVARSLEKAEASQTPRASLAVEGSEVRLEAPQGPGGELFLVQFLKAGAHDTPMVNPVTALHPIVSPAAGRLDISTLDCPSGCALLYQAAGTGAIQGALRLH